MKAYLKNNYTGKETPFKTVLEYGRYDGGLYLISIAKIRNFFPLTTKTTSRFTGATSQKFSSASAVTGGSISK